MKNRIVCLLLFLMSNINAAPIAVMPDLVSSFQNVRDFTVHENEAYFSAQNTLGDLSVIIRIEKIENKWANPTIASFSGIHHDIEPFLTTNGLKLYFASKRPKISESKSDDYDIWYVVRNKKNEKWSEPINMGAVINTDKNEFYPSLADNGNLYFTANYSDSKGKDDIYFSEYINAEYHKPYSLSESINSEGDEYNAYIADDETYLIFGSYNRADGLGSGDLYISYKQEDKHWSPAKNMGSTINSAQMDYCPFVNSNKLYFTSKRIDRSKKKFNSIDELLSTFNSIENGMSRIYQIDLNLELSGSK